MWSGPRNISTAMMRAWGNRDDTVVIDEPLYAYYLQATGKQHPGANEVIATGETDWRKVIAHVTGPIPKMRRSAAGAVFMTWDSRALVSPICGAMSVKVMLSSVRAASTAWRRMRASSALSCV